MSDTILVFVLGVPLFIIGTTVKVWSSFQLTGKDDKASKSLIIGSVITAIIVIIELIILGFVYAAPQTNIKQILTEILNTKIGVDIFILWTLILLAGPRFINYIVRKIINIGAVQVSPTKVLSKKESKTDKNDIEFQDPFRISLEKWYTISGNPHITSIRGKPKPPSLLLDENLNDNRHTFILAKELRLTSGKISCDVYLERGAIFNLVFRANPNASEYYMARVDARNKGSNGFLKANNSREWGYIEQSKTPVLSDRWYHIELFINESKFELNINDDEKITMENSAIIARGQVGMFNELKRVYVNNFIVTK